MFTQMLLKSSGNLVQNPSFENSLEFWTANGVTTGNNNPAEGTQVAILGPGVASLAQDIKLCRWRPQPLFLSLIAYQANGATNSGNLVLQVLWLDSSGNTLAAGLDAFLPNSVFGNAVRITFYGITDTPPLGAVFARLLISKGESAPATDQLAVDHVILTPVKTANLVQNPSFEAGMASWNASGFVPNFSSPFEGSAEAFASGAGTLSQDIPIALFPWRSSYLLSFAVQGDVESVLSVRLEWLNAANNVIGTPGLDLSIPGITLANQNGFLTYLNISEPAPIGAVRARILFTGSGVAIDQVVFALVDTENLVQNPSFVTLDQWVAINTIADVSADSYEGTTVAEIDQGGGVLFQNVSLPFAAGRCFLLNFGLGYNGGLLPNGNIMVEVIWLNRAGREIGPGLSLTIPLFVYTARQWLVYAGITEAAPLFAAGARIQFTKSAGGTGGSVDVDNVVFGKLT